MNWQHAIFGASVATGIVAVLGALGITATYGAVSFRGRIIGGLAGGVVFIAASLVAAGTWPR